ncbi:ATP-binding protein [Streptomyces canus]|uniref:ATP-binding protein n=1 Tax=Streptomyces canus TaxID=58343 RepID=UPI0033C56852
MPTGIDVTAYRIIQEALTNALKHGDGAKAEVTVRYAKHYLRIEVLNSGPSVWLVTAKWQQPAVAQAEDQGRLQQLGRKRSRWMAVCLVAAAVLWPVLDFFFLFFLLNLGCDFASC